MIPSVSILPKPDSSSTHSTQNSFKAICELKTQNLVGPFVKLQHLFAKKPKHKHNHQKLTQKNISLHKKQNVTYINLGIDEEHEQVPISPKGTFPNRLKIKQVRTQRNDRHPVNFTFHEKPKQSKRHRHRSQLQTDQKYTLLAPNRSKEHLQKFQKKLIDSLQKKENFDKNTLTDCKNAMSFLENFKTQPIIENSFSGRHSKLKDEETAMGSQNSLHKWKILATKYHNSQNMPFSLHTSSALNRTQTFDSGKKKLSRKYSREKKTLIAMYPFFRSGEKLHQKGLGFPESCPEKQSLNIEVIGKYEPNVVIKQKFKLAKFSKKFQDMSVEIQNETSEKELEKENLQDSRNKLKKLLKRSRKRQAKDKNIILAPWDVPSDNEIDMSP